MLIVVALGGNALLRRGEPLDAEVQRRNVKTAAAAIAELARAHRVVVTHGNGPQVGLLALQAAAYEGAEPYPLDVLGAESEGMIGYLLEQAVANELRDREVATLLTQVVVDRADPAFAVPSKPVGPVYDHETALRVAAEHGWSIAPDGDQWRRVVPSPAPRAIVELHTIELLVQQDVVVVCAGGGGVPVTVDEGAGYRGVEAVVDKDATSALLAMELGADRLLLLTDVEGVAADWGTPGQRLIRATDPDAIERIGFAAGSMGPKVAAACRFVRDSGGTAGIGALADALAVLEGGAGTTITPAG
jgi:carbamate kinase